MARRKRRSRTVDDHRVRVEKAVTSAAVEDSGKLHPAKLEVEPAPRQDPPKLKLVKSPPPAASVPKKSKGGKRKATVSHERIDKAKDVSAYNPAVVSDAVLRDDFRILLGWHAKRSRDDDFEHDFETIEAQLKKLLKEAAKRGPTAIQFDPKALPSKVRPVFERLARAVKMPKASFKRLVLKVDTDPGDLTTVELFEAHDRMHTTQVAKAQGHWGAESVTNMHALVVGELGDRGVAHPPPPNDGLDATSAEFERPAIAKRVERSTPVKKAKPRTAPVGRVEQARSSRDTDTVTAGAFLFQPMPTSELAQSEDQAVAKSAKPDEVDSVTKALELFDERPELFPTVVQKCSGGVRHQIHKAAGEVAIYSEDGEDHTARLPGLVQEVQALKSENLVLDVEVDVWKGRERWPHEATIEYLASAEDPDDSGVEASIVDMVYSDAGDIHVWPTVQRLKKLAQLDIRKAEQLRIAPAIKVSDLAQFERAARMLGDLPGAEGVIAKRFDAKYPLTKTAEDWVAMPLSPAQMLVKQADPFLEIPKEGDPHPYVVQHHWKGKSLHADFRAELRPGKLLLGWRLKNQIEGATKKPVTTLAEARAMQSRFGGVSKIDWGSGDWSTVSVLAERMPPAPAAWLDIEGKTKDPQAGKAAPVGGSAEFPGVYHIVDQGLLEYGAQKPWVHEYFMQGAAMRYRLIFRQVQIGKLTKARHAHAKCMHCGTAKPQVDVVWADGRGRAWFCRKCYPVWLKDVGGPKKAELIGSKAIVGGRAPKNFGDIYKNAEISKSAEVHPVVKKATPVDLEKPMGGPRWVAVKASDNTPHVLSADAVAKKWMPPAGVSALPKAVRDAVPKDRQYWLQRTVSTARKMRDALVTDISEGKTAIDVDAPFVEVAKAAPVFVLQSQTWEGAKKGVWHLRVDMGKRKLLVVTMLADPLDNEKVVAHVSVDAKKASLKASGSIRPGHYLNPTKSKQSSIDVVDKGSAKVLEIDSDFLKLRVKGKELNGTFTATRNGNDWLWTPVDQAKAKAEAALEKRAVELAGRKRFVSVQKID
ncbi:MAG: ATP-dependent DNA ligase, partial [Alphaproteobacteria bacterium]